ncbi:MAG: DNA translocase FtsK, partial [Elusimicrobia bacterium]|nr:DNA translocase FtsK [Elusimicrobiota bacterium]
MAYKFDPARHFYQRLSRKSRRPAKTSFVVSAGRAATVLAAALWVAWLLIFPASSGPVGRALSESLFKAFGRFAYLLPAFLLYGFFGKTLSRRPFSLVLFAFFSGLFFLSMLSLAAAAGRQFGFDAWGGTAGAAVFRFIAAASGAAGVWIAAIFLFFLSSYFLFDIAWDKLFLQFGRWLWQDYKNWVEARKELTRQMKALAPQNSSQPDPLPGLPISPTPFPELSEATQISDAAAPPASRSRAALEPQNGAPGLEEAAQPPAKNAASPPGKAAPVVAPPYELPPVSLLEQAVAFHGPTGEEVRDSMRRLEQTLHNFGIDARSSGFSPGPVITRYELTPAPGVKVSSIVTLSNDLALAMQASSIRILAPIPGKAAIGIEIPNRQPAIVGLREIMESEGFTRSKSPLVIAMGKTAEGKPLVDDLVQMPHLLVAGATNSGKSVFIHALILSILFRARPDEVKLLLVDPKRLELTFYEGIPHLYDPQTPARDVSVVTHPKAAARSLKALTKIMEQRYDKFSKYNVRSISSYNEEAARRGEPKEYYIVVIIDELADLMLTSKDAVEDSIQRLSQMARAVGIHLVLSTQRPSVDVITGIIKANLTARVSLQVISKVDSRVILDAQGAEDLLGRGDMLYLATGAQRPSRIQGAYVSESEIKRIADFLRKQGRPAYEALYATTPEELDDPEKATQHKKELLTALKLVSERRRISQDLLKAHFGSSARATNLLSLLEIQGYIHKPEGSNRWEINFDKIEAALESDGKDEIT